MLGALLMLVVPTYTSRLSFAFLPSLLGHVFDIAFLCWLAGNLARLGERRTLFRGALLLSACQLAYVSGVVNMTLFTLVVAATEWAGAPRDGAPRALRLVAMTLAASALSLVVYYRDFLPMLLDLLPRIAGAEAGSVSRYPVRGWLQVAYERTRDFFDGVYPLLAAAGVAVLWRRGAPRTLLLAWPVTYALLLLGRAKVPDVFLHGHETLLFTPFVCLAAGEAIAAIASRGRPWRVLGGLVCAFLAVQGLAAQWRAMADQLGNAR
jgi:hypothetical protein